MAHADTDQFPDDPQLREALRTLYAPEQASAALRERVTEILTTGTAAGTPLSLAKTRAWRRWVLPAAAAAAVAAAVAAPYAWDEYKQYRLEQAELALYQGNAPVIDAMLQTQATGKGPEDEAATASLADPAAIAVEASTKLKRPVPVPKLPGGWQLTSAGYCTIGGHRAARFTFELDGKSIALLSMSVYNWYGEQGKTDYALRANDQAIAGYIDGMSLNCIVGGHCMELPTVVSLRDSLRSAQ